MIAEAPVEIRTFAQGAEMRPFFMPAARGEILWRLYFAEVRGVLQSCKWCGRIHPLGFVCPRKPQPHRKNTEAQRFRNTSQWKQTRARVNERDAHLCRLCLQEGRLEHEGLSTHHIIPLEETMRYACDDDWCITLCDGHHKAADRGEYGRAQLHELALEVPRLPRREV